ncbi:glycerophosphodiester phosphodiesterase family protein [Microaceticoccus formicicus]|uniref:glycerophosphodiester phosphodiesterase family protein n=1 Tax=Microaceticoccus formicicus TaxID=3118105 RepID=UPI003CD022A1|nr:glycerophosphodiester phosphodiesterase family protein [Peptoniphilaceae bacterium AMB_02]
MFRKFNLANVQFLLKRKYSIIDIKSLLVLIKTNLSAFIFCQLLIIYSFLIFNIFRRFLVNILKNQIGVNLLVQDNFLEILKHPLAILVLILFFIIQLFFVFFGIIGNYRIYAASLRGEKIGIPKLIKEVIFTYVKLFSPNRIAIIPILIFTMLLSYISFYTSSIENFKIPEFITDWIAEKKYFEYAFTAFRIYMTYIWFRVLFVITGMLLFNRTFKEAVQFVREVFAIRKKKYLVFIISIMAIIFFLKTFIYYILLSAAFIFSKVFNVDLVLSLYSMNWRALIYIQSITDVLQIGLLVVGYCKFFEIETTQIRFHESKVRKRSVAFSMIIAVLLIELFHLNYNTNQLLVFQNLRPKIIAHRAGATFGPENSLKALEITRNSKVASAVEIDVQLTKDREVILNHDSTLQRITGNGSRAIDLNLSEIKKLKTRGEGGFFYEDSIPTLGEFLDKVGSLEIMIELKSDNEYVEELLDKTMEIVKDKKLEDKIIISSMNRKVLEISKAKNPKVKTALISAILLGADFEQEYIDIYSIEAAGLNHELVNNAHEKGKEIYVWTINTAKGVKQVLKFLPDGIVTDNVFYVDYAIYNLEDSIPFQSDIFRMFI